MFPDLRCSLYSRPLLALFIGVEDQPAKNDLLSRRPRRLRRLPPPLSLAASTSAELIFEN